jgi:segregation and condensation protein A
MRIKAKMLIPRVEKDEEGNKIDPREELVRHLLEYKKYKSVLSELESWEENMLQKEKRGNLKQELKNLAETSNVEAELQDLDLYKILKVYQRVMKKIALKTHTHTHQVKPYPYTISEQKILLLDQLQLKKKLSFEEVIGLERNKIAVIFNFLAILELMQLQRIRIQLGEGFNNFWIMQKDEKMEKADKNTTNQ